MIKAAHRAVSDVQGVMADRVADRVGVIAAVGIAAHTCKSALEMKKVLT